MSIKIQLSFGVRQYAIADGCTYFFLRGKGEFQVDGRVFPVGEGSVVRVAPDGRRSVRNNGTEPLVMLCVQYRGNTFTAKDATDGNLLNEPVKW